MRTTDLFTGLGSNTVELLDDAVKFENDRIASRIPVLRHQKTNPSKDSHYKQCDVDGKVILRKPGAKPGTRRTDGNKMAPYAGSLVFRPEQNVTSITRTGACTRSQVLSRGADGRPPLREQS